MSLPQVPEIAQNGAQLGHIGLGFLGGAQVRLGDDFHQGDAGAAETDQERLAGVLVMDRPAGILLKVQALDADLEAAVLRYDDQQNNAPRRRWGSCTG